MRLFPMGIKETARELLWPTRCVSCDLPGELLCEECRAAMPWIDQRWACPVCGAPYGWLTCTECHEDVTDVPQQAGHLMTRETSHALSWILDGTVCACTFEGPAARLVTTYKDGHELRLAPIIVAAMAGALEEAEGYQKPDGTSRIDLASTDIICFVPATKEAFTRRGFDHMEAVSKHLSALTGIPLADILVRKQVADQRKLGKDERKQNLAHTIRAIDDVSGLNVLVADDVLTTGSSINEAARALKVRGAAHVSAITLARVW